MVKPEDVMKALSGTWLYLNVTTFNDNGTISHEEDPGLGASPTGMLHYNAAGLMSANFMSGRAADRPAGVDSAAIDVGSDADWALIGKHTLSYAGPYRVTLTTDDVEEGQITHGPTRVAWLPSWVGRELEKNYTLYDDDEVMRFIARTQDGRISHQFFQRLA
ncbi:Lipocalin-like domain-containing protein [Hypoxylon sp. FL1284]|nr:Lipocalin-like domain-containing protein [Hypoxylon sp. FL1284]